MIHDIRVFFHCTIISAISCEQHSTNRRAPCFFYSIFFLIKMFTSLRLFHVFSRSHKPWHRSYLMVDGLSAMKNDFPTCEKRCRETIKENKQKILVLWKYSKKRKHNNENETSSLYRLFAVLLNAFGNLESRLLLKNLSFFCFFYERIEINVSTTIRFTRSSVPDVLRNQYSWRTREKKHRLEN